MSKASTVLKPLNIYGKIEMMQKKRHLILPLKSQIEMWTKYVAGKWLWFLRDQSLKI